MCLVPHAILRLRNPGLPQRQNSRIFNAPRGLFGALGDDVRILNLLVQHGPRLLSRLDGFPTHGFVVFQSPCNSVSISVKVCLCDSSLGHVSSFISIRRCHDWAGGTRTTAADTALEKTGVRASLPVSSACKNHLSRPTSAAKPAQAAAHGAPGASKSILKLSQACAAMLAIPRMIGVLTKPS
ncbi:hypothetical protein PCL_06984 [Purpureocillium lilacinum]|uniref:Uncharacterized protein n=1 Tax=Purpureocillium lilacinum TaxID=33203 RepID=A0A2U3DTH8_PURLI|nr:hypothetical protein Purlil1_7910 [Purpureocillium lilacinum]PWI65565.1 hypothetical protein PCL_06984 [Purpureocillium lilacinum]